MQSKSQTPLEAAAQAVHDAEHALENARRTGDPLAEFLASCRRARAYQALENELFDADPQAALLAQEADDEAAAGHYYSTCHALAA